MRKKELYEQVIHYFEKEMPIAESELNYSNPFELLVAVILSAQCTDKRVNLTTPALFRDYPTARAMAASSQEIMFEYIRSISFPNNKSKYLVNMARLLVEDYNEIVPSTLDDLIRLPGVGRKTANVIQSVIFNKAAMAVDTHVFRVSHRIGLVSAKQTTPYATEQILMKYIPKEIVPKAHHWLILHGRYVCIARAPKCDQCGLTGLCEAYRKNPLDPKCNDVKLK